MPIPPQQLPIGVQNYPEIATDSLLYVDKTAYIAKMISEHGTKAWFLGRPRRFGKSLIVSTLKTVFSGQRELFKGLAIEERLDEEIFAARPVIALDMSLVTNILGIEEFQKSLGRVTSSSAVWRGAKSATPNAISSPVEPFLFRGDPDLPPGEILSDLITNLSKLSGQRIAVLIDEYDKPYLDLIKTPKEAEKVRATMRDYFTRLKAIDEYISFIFVTGISKFSRMGVFSALNNLRDISVSPEYATICGFTQEELSGPLGARVEAVAASLGKNRNELLKELKDYYDGFSFDGVTRVFNPFSVMLFLAEKVFDNYWFDSGTPQIIAQYIKGKRLTVEEFRGMATTRSFIKNPGEIGASGAASFLYQAGYLSVRADKLTNKYTLDYPNREVYESMSRLLVENFFGDANIAEGASDNLRNALVLCILIFFGYGGRIMVTT
ncbi:MAG: AAA family ATPase [Deltaproteobacteria bacterium]|jgi:hypothetical protein|nr:AAA family ATPase [Deltaproteobacteria bacterium]